MDLRPGYKLSAAGVIPEDWEAEPVGAAFEIRNQLRLPLSQAVRERMNGPYPYFGPTSAQGWINEYRIEGEHSLIGEDGDHFLKWRTHPMTLLVNGKFNVNNHAHVVKGAKNLTAWFYWFFINRDICDYLTRQGASRYKLTKAALQQLPCAIPPREEQAAITTVLSETEALLSGLDRLIAKKRDLKLAAMQKLLSGEIRLSGGGGEWETAALGDLALISKGEQLRSEDLDDAGAFAHLNGGITPSGYTAKSNTRANTIAISEGGNSCGFVQFMAEPYWCGGHCYSVVPKGIENRFLYQALKRRQHEIMALRVGSGLPNVQKTALLGFKLRFPTSSDEQNDIAAVLFEMDAELTILEARRDKTRALKQGMMQELLTGRTRLV